MRCDGLVIGTQEWLGYTKQLAEHKAGAWLLTGIILIEAGYLKGIPLCKKKSVAGVV